MAADERPLSVVIPCYNEASTVREVLQRVAAAPLVGEIVVVDDASRDGTGAILEEILASWPADRPALRVFRHPVNQGKGAALRTGFRRVTREIAIVQDADLEYDPREYPKLLQPILDGDADVVYGSRFAGFPRRVLYYWHSLGNRVLTTLSNMATDLNLTDMETGYKAFKSEIIRSIPIRCDRFGFEPEVTAKIAKLGCRIYEVPISYRGRSYDEGKKIGLWDAIKAVGVILRFKVVNDLGLETGSATLKLLEKATRYNGWIYETIRPWLGREILEVGSGIGNMTRYLARAGRVTATDNAAFYLRELRRSFRESPNVAVRELDLTRPPLPGHGLFDSVVCLNVLEHIEDDTAAIRNMLPYLRPGGRAVIFVPANPRLYCGIDRGVGHHRRYTKEELVGKITDAGFRVAHARTHNILGALGWWVNGKVFRKRALSGGDVRGFNLLMPLIHFQERFESRFSLSVLAIGVKG
jgi:glycosyltransferase involved in cell wall biosynthesis